MLLTEQSFDQTKPPIGTRVNRSHPLGSLINWCAILNESAGPTAFDAAANNNGTFQGTKPFWTFGRFGSAATYDHSDNYINVPNAAILNPGDKFWLSVWFKRNVTGGTQAIVDKGANGYELAFASDFLALAKDNVAIIAQSTSTITDKLWHHAAIRKNGPSVNILVDAKDVTGSISNQTIVGTTQPLRIGEDQFGNPFSGSLDLPIVGSGFPTIRQLQSLYTDPFCFLEPDQVWVQELTGVPWAYYLQSQRQKGLVA